MFCVTCKSENNSKILRCEYAYIIGTLRPTYDGVEFPNMLSDCSVVGKGIITILNTHSVFESNLGGKIGKSTRHFFYLGKMTGRL